MTTASLSPPDALPSSGNALISQGAGKLATRTYPCKSSTMWWKLTLLTLITLVLVIAVQPIRTHVVTLEVQRNGPIPSVPRQSFFDMFSAMYVTPGSLVISAVIIGVAAYLAFRIVR